MVKEAGFGMKEKAGKILHSDLAFDIIVNAIGVVIVLIVLVPLIFVIAASFSKTIV